MVAEVTIFLSDTFSVANGTPLENTAPQVGGPWLRRAGRTAGIVITDMRCAASAAVEYRYTNSAAPASADYTITMDFTRVAAGTKIWGLLARYIDDRNYYIVHYSNSAGTYYLRKCFKGKFATLASLAEVHTGLKNWRFEVVGASQKLYINDVLKLSGTNAELTAPGFAGITMSAQYAEAYGDNIVADSIAPPEHAFMQPRKVWDQT